MSGAEKRATEEVADVEAALDDAAEAVAVRAKALDELNGGAPTGEGVGMGKLMGVSVEVTVEVGRVRMSLGELVALAPGSLVDLEREAHEPADILVNGKVVAHGEIVTIDDSYGVRITSVND